MKIAITGHRPNKLDNDYDLTSKLMALITGKIQQVIQKHNPDILITGMALGIDTLFAKLAIHNNIPFIAAIPCKGQHSNWPAKSVNEYMNLLTKAQHVYVIDSNRDYGSREPAAFHEWLKSDGSYSPIKMQLRNQWMVNNCDILIAVWDGSNGGTKNCVDYAKSVNKQIIYINPKDFINDSI